MLALTLTQPWASLVAWEEKRIETRSWGTGYRGPIAIHAAKGFPRWARDLCDEEPFRSVLRAHGAFGVADLPKGAVVATARLVACRSTGTDGQVPDWLPPMGRQEWCFGDFGSLRWGWFLADVVALPVPAPAVGALGLWEWRAPAHVA